jgi:hypothetical protein
MRRIALQETVPGMVLAKPITNPAGLVVVAAGVILDETLIARLEQMGKSAVYVGGSSAEGTPDKSIGELEQEVAWRFRKVGADPVQIRIKEAICKFMRAAHPEHSSGEAKAAP